MAVGIQFQSGKVRYDGCKLYFSRVSLKTLSLAAVFLGLIILSVVSVLLPSTVVDTVCRKTDRTTAVERLTDVVWHLREESKSPRTRCRKRSNASF